MDKNVDPGVVLNDARKARAAGDYALALERYRWFYENATKIKPSYYGVRFSYCLDEWSALAANYPPARESLLRLKLGALERFNGSFSESDFREYTAIARCLDGDLEVMERFRLVEQQNKVLAGKLFSCVYELFVRQGMWDACYRYMGGGLREYEKSLDVFDSLAKLAAMRRDQKISDQAQCMYKKQVSKLRKMLSKFGTDEDRQALEARIENDLRKRGYESVSFWGVAGER